MDFQEIIGVIAPALQIGAKELAALKDGENWLADDELKEKLPELIKMQVTAVKDAQHKRGTRESWAVVEKWVKSQGFEGGEDLKGAELLTAFSEQIKGIDGKADKMTREELEALPAVKTLISERLSKHANNAKSEVEKVKAEFDAYRKQTETERVKTRGRDYIIRQLEESEVLLEPKGTGVKKEARIDAILQTINWNKIGLNKDGIPVMLSDDGQPEVDDFGAEKSVAEFAVKTGLAIYGKVGPDPNKGGAEPKPGNANPGKYVPVHVFATENDYTAAYSKAATPQDRLQVTRDWQHQQQKATAG